MRIHPFNYNATSEIRVKDALIPESVSGQLYTLDESIVSKSWMAQPINRSVWVVCGSHLRWNLFMPRICLILNVCGAVLILLLGWLFVMRLSTDHYAYGKEYVISHYDLGWSLNLYVLIFIISYIYVGPEPRKINFSFKCTSNWRPRSP